MLFSGYTESEVSKVKNRRLTPGEDLRLSPQCRLCPLYDACSIREFPVAAPEMGVRVVDNCAEENIQ